MPSDCPAIRPRGLARSGCRVTATRTPFSSALLSVSPTPATSGRVKTVPAIASRLIGSTGRPSAESAEMRPCMAAVEASIQPPVTSPAAEMCSFVVRQQPLITISPRGPTSTPTDSRPSSSVCARMPMQMIAWVPLNSRPSWACTRTRVADALDVGCARAQLDRHAALEEGLVHDVGDVAILRGQDLRARREQRDARAAALEELGELAAGRAGADDQQLLGQRRAGPSTSRVLSTRWWSTCANGGSHGRRAGAHEQVVVLERARAALGRHDEHAVALDGALRRR